jgi:hypothetical protein
MALVNAYRATTGCRALPVSQINTNEYYGLDIRASKSIPISAGRKVELIAQVFNLLNRTNLAAAWQTNALSSSFGIISSAVSQRQAEVGVRFSF